MIIDEIKLTKIKEFLLQQAEEPFTSDQLAEYLGWRKNWRSAHLVCEELMNMGMIVKLHTVFCPDQRCIGRFRFEQLPDAVICPKCHRAFIPKAVASPGGYYLGKVPCNH